MEGELSQSTKEMDVHAETLKETKKVTELLSMVGHEIRLMRTGLGKLADLIIQWAEEDRRQHDERLKYVKDLKGAT